MTTKINGRTPEEIKKGLETCAAVQGCRNCPYSGTRCVIEVSNDVIAYIQQLERERDAAKADLKSVVASNEYSGDFCKYCKYNEPDGQCYHHCIPYSSEWGWQWRGVQEVE